MAENKAIKETYKIGVTHGGRFHTDDVLSTALLKGLFPAFEVIRLTNYDASKVPKGALVYDIGGGEYDHHRREVCNRFGMPYSALGLLWRDFGERYLAERGFTHIEMAKRWFEEKYISKVDQGDNCGYALVSDFPENELIVGFNPLWYEEARSDERFSRAVAFAGEILELWTRRAYQVIEMTPLEDAIWENAKARSKDGIFVFDEGIPWRSVAKRHVEDGLLIAIGKSNRSGYYVMPAEGSGLVVPDDPLLVFRHVSGFLGIAAGLDDALSVARHTLAAVDNQIDNSIKRMYN